MAADNQSDEVRNSAKGRATGPTIIREIAAILIWGYILVDFFILDFNIYLSSFSESTEALWFPWFRLLLVLTALIVLVWIMGTRRTTRFVFYVTIYPFRVVFYYLFKLVFRKPESLVVIVPSAIYWLKTFRTRAVVYVLAWIGITLILLKASVTASWIGIVLCLIYLLIHYYLQFKKAISTSRYMSGLVEEMRSSWQKSEATSVAKDRGALDKLEEGTEEYDTKKTSNIKDLLLLNSLHYFFADKVRGAMKNHVVELGLVSSVCISFCITVLIYATCYHGLAWISSDHFSNVGSYWDFINVSFGALIHDSIPGFSPKSTLAQFLTRSEQACGILLLVFLMFFLATVMRESFRDCLNHVIAEFESDYQYYESQLQEHYSLSLPEAIKLIEANTKSSDRVRMFITRHIRVTIQADE